MADPRLERAREHCFLAGVDDSALRLSAANLPYGLAKIHYVQEQLGLPADATFVASPDATITRNVSRWRQGFGYGGMYRWSGDFHVLDIKANACGMLVGSLPELPARDTVSARLAELEAGKLQLDGITLESDLTETNHFVDVLEIDPDGSPEPPTGDRYYFIMHSSGHEHRGPTERGIGLYWDKSEPLDQLARHFDTPWGTLRILEGDDAAEWYRFFRQVDDFNHRRRATIAELLFGDYRPVVNATHQGLVRGYNTANIGCYTYPADAPADQRLFPLTLSPSHPAFLIRGADNLNPTTLRRLGWDQRAERLGVAERLTDCNFLPHGGGYTYPHLRGVSRVIEDGPDQRRFELEPVDPTAERPIITAPRQLEFAYRGLEVLERMEELELGRVAAKLELKYIVGA